MEITLLKLVNTLATEAIFSEQKLPIKVAYSLSKIYKIAKEECEFYQQKFTEIINKYSERDENGQPVLLDDGTSISIKKDEIDNCSEELKELQNFKIEIPDFSFKLEDFGDVQLTLEEMEPLLEFICEN